MEFVRNTSNVCNSACASGVSSHTYYLKLSKREFYVNDFLIDEFQNYHDIIIYTSGTEISCMKLLKLKS